MEACKAFLAHIPQRVASVVTHSLLDSSSPVTLPHLDASPDSVVLNVQVSCLPEIVQMEDHTPASVEFLTQVLRAISKTGGDLLTLEGKGITVVFAPQLNNGSTKEELLARAVVCAFDLQAAAGKMTGSPTVKAGIALGQVCSSHRCRNYCRML